MAKPTIEQVKEAAKRACFYVDADGEYYRMNYCDDDFFSVTNEDTGDFHTISYEDAANGHFEELVRINY